MSEDSKAIRLLLWVGIPLLAILAMATWFVVANRPPVVHVPSHKMPNPNGWDDFAAAGQLLTPQASRGPYSSTRPVGQWTTEEMGTWLVSATPALQRMRRGLPKKCMHPLMRSFRSNYYPPYARLRELARVSSSAALYYDRTGKPGRAANSLLDAAEMGVMVQHGGTLISGMVGTATEFIPMNHLEPLLPKLNAAELARVAGRMEVIRAKRVSYSEIVLEEGKYNAALTAEMFRQDRGIEAACDLAGWFTPQRTAGIDSVKHCAAFALTDKTRMISENMAYMKALAKEQRGPYTGESKIPMPKNVFAFVAVGRNRIPFVRNEAYSALLRTEVALLRYRKVNGRYPISLSDLRPRYLKSKETDPFGGKPLHYGVTKGGKSYLLYSIGPDLKDNHGSPIPSGYNIIGFTGDIVAGKLTKGP